MNVSLPTPLEQRRRRQIVAVKVMVSVTHCCCRLITGALATVIFVPIDRMSVRDLHCVGLGRAQTRLPSAAQRLPRWLYIAPLDVSTFRYRDLANNALSARQEIAER